MKFNFSSKNNLKILFGIFLIWVSIIFLMSSTNIVEGMKKPIKPIYSSTTEANAAAAAAAADLAARQRKLETELKSYRVASDEANKKASNESKRQRIPTTTNVKMGGNYFPNQVRSMFSFSK